MNSLSTSKIKGQNIVVIEKNINSYLPLSLMKKRGLYVILLSADKYLNKVHRDEKAVINELHIIDTADEQKVLALCQAINQQRSINAIVSLFEYFIPLAAKIAISFGLPSNTVDTCNRARNKLLMRNALAESSIPIPKYCEARNFNNLDFCQQLIGFPNIIKPVDLAGSRNVFLNANVLELKNNYQKIQNQVPIYGFEPSDIALIEEFVEGSEFSIESYTFEGQTEIIAITEKTVSGGSTFVELGHQIPACVSAEINDKIVKLVQATLKSIGIKTGVCHTEVKLGDNGSLKVIETAARPAGDRIVELVELATGYSLWEAFIDAAFGIQTCQSIQYRRFSGIYFLTSKPGTIQCIDGRDSCFDIPNVVEVNLYKKIGDTIGPLLNNSDRIGEVIATGDTGASVKRTLRCAARKLSIKIDER